MFKQILIGLGIFLFGAILNDGFGVRPLGSVIAYAGLIYSGVVFLCFILPAIPKAFGSAKDRRDTEKAHEGLLKLKQLLDQEIITKEEFDKKAADLRAKVLL